MNKLSKITLLTGLALGLGTVACLPQANAGTHVVISVGVAPPPLRVERVPPARAGYVWVGGYWRWNSVRYVWMPGTWHRARPGYVYAHPTWVRADGRWVYHEGAWRRHDRRVDRRVDRRHDRREDRREDRHHDH